MAHVNFQIPLKPATIEYGLQKYFEEPIKEGNTCTRIIVLVWKRHDYKAYLSVGLPRQPVTTRLHVLAGRSPVPPSISSPSAEGPLETCFLVASLY